MSRVIVQISAPAQKSFPPSVQNTRSLIWSCLKKWHGGECAPCRVLRHSPEQGSGMRGPLRVFFFYFKFKQTLLETDLSAGQKAPSQAVLFPSLLQLCLSFFPMPFTITVFPSLEAKQLESWKRSVVRRVIKIGIDAAGSQGSVTSLALCVSVMSDTVALPCVASLCIFYCLVLPENVDPGVAALCKQSAVEGSALCKPFMFPL